MQLEHHFTVPVPAVQAWEALLDVERIAPCMPGATVDSFDGQTIEGKVKVKVGPIQVAYAGTAKFVEKDAASHRAVIEASARESRGAGTAAATITAVLAEAGSSTDVTVTICRSPASLRSSVAASWPTSATRSWASSPTASPESSRGMRLRPRKPATVLRLPRYAPRRSRTPSPCSTARGRRCSSGSLRWSGG